MISMYSENSLIWTCVIVSEVSSFQRLKRVQEWYIFRVRKRVLFRAAYQLLEVNE